MRDLPGVLVRDVEVETCPTCGEGYTLPRIAELHRLLALALASKRGRLTGPEVRFIRGVLGLRGKELARRMGVTPVTVSRWENGKEPLGPTTERLLRLMAAAGTDPRGFDLAVLDRVGGEPVPLRAAARFDGERWHLGGAPERTEAGEARV